MVLHHNFFDDKTNFLTFEQIRSAIEAQPANAIKLELSQLVNRGEVEQRTETRERTGIVGLPIQGGQTYQVALDGYRLSRSGIIKIDQFDDERYARLEATLGLDQSQTENSGADPWEPIPLDRDDTAQARATEALDQVVEELRKDNGYSASNPEEKAFVQDKLSAVSKRLKEDTQTSWMYLLEFAVKPLRIVLRRFGAAALGVAALSAKEALISWLKTRGISILDDMFK
ncbi:hypothetical protein [Bradyrhizobium sp.]|uniref:hypothetical protein n=1 Tax=Bradyrhizobium sp. TaxID=376 RepID=UPI001ED716C4|nr:hypothetical protein [Bradyrhizobium sp.]MBU6456993.1 hypothetical protein [Bradyrhizobium sp.]